MISAATKIAPAMGPSPKRPRSESVALYPYPPSTRRHPATARIDDVMPDADVKVVIGGAGRESGGPLPTPSAAPPASTRPMGSVPWRRPHR